MKQHVVSVDGIQYHFKEVDSPYELEPAMQVWSPHKETLTEFVAKLHMPEQWVPYGYFLRAVHRSPTGFWSAHLYKLGEKFLTR